MKLIKLFTILFMLLNFNSINAQTNLGNTFSGSGNPATLLCPQTRAAFTDEKVNQLIVEILNVSNLKNRFIIMPCSGISNCQAIYYEGKPYILYNAAFLNEIKGLSFSEKDLVVSERNWESLTILAHELGHHFNNHLNNPPPGATPQQLELEADEFAGSTIYMLGGSLIQSQSAFKSESVSESYTHPGRMARLAAVAKGWNDAAKRSPKSKGGKFNPSPSNNISEGFNSVLIGQQEWMSKNLDVVRFRNGDVIMEAKTLDEWIRAGEKKQPAWCNYENDPINGIKKGKLYNWYAVNDKRGLAPIGWHVPTIEEWYQLSVYHNEDAKSFRNNTGWSVYETWSGNGTNKYNFSALPSGWRTDNSKSSTDVEQNGFYDSEEAAYWWSSSVSELEKAWVFGVMSIGSDFERFKETFGDGFAVRCVKD
jgi:uncharacterized protein (TIGR02145 family)